MTKTFITPILEPTTRAKLTALVNNVVHGEEDLNLEWLKVNKYVAVPVESAGHFDHNDIKRIAHAIKISGQRELYAVATERLNFEEEFYAVDPSEKGLAAFNKACWFFNFALLDVDASFVVLCTAYDYFVVAGTRTFVEAAVGKDLEAAIEEFREFAALDDDKNRTRLMAVLQKYNTT